jgi:hypothetical protein
MRGVPGRQETESMHMLPAHKQATCLSQAAVRLSCLLLSTNGA